MWINCYQSPTGPHYSRPHATLEAAAANRAALLSAKTIGPFRFVGSLRLTLKAPALAALLNGGPTVFSEPEPEDEPEQGPPEGYVNATALNRAGCRTWPNYWRAKSAKARASTLAAQLGIPVEELVLTRTGGDVSKQGTFVHPAIAEHFRAWLGIGAERQEAA